ncbi:Thioredoxin-like protein AAED1, partial [Teratosphaeria destructans]
TSTTSPPSTPSHSLPPADADEWFAQFRSDPELATTVSDQCPDRATLAAVYDVPIYAADGQAMPFGSIYDPAYALHRRQLVLFVRHFYCGACQAYLQALSQSITKEDYFAIPTPTSIIVIGCGQPDLIPQYKKFTGCPFPIYADPTRQLFKKLGMIVTLNIGGERPDYMKDIGVSNWAAGQFKTIKKSLKDEDGIRKRDILRGGHPLQIGGEFLFDEGEVVWCHRMGNMRNHTEVRQLRKLLELEVE